MTETTYNERSWAMDMASEIKTWASSHSGQIRRAGGEEGLKVEGTTLFPDLFLFDEDNEGNILQGWELKFPDTPITDSELIENAHKKAHALKLNSFLVWNVTTAELWEVTSKTDRKLVKTWNAMPGITKRDQVKPVKADIWKALHEILKDLNDYILNGTIRSVSVVDSVTGSAIAQLITRNAPRYQEALELKASSDRTFKDEINLWWRSVKTGYPKDSNPYRELAVTRLLGVVNKFVFAHTLKSTNTVASAVNSIDSNMRPSEGFAVFEEISNAIDFWTIFKPAPGEDLLPEAAWNDLTEFNRFLSSLRLEKISNEYAKELLASLVAKNQRKIAGQFATPKPLAELLVELTLDDASAMVLDPCCGSGTIIRAAYDYKRNASLSVPDAFTSTWFSDKFSLPIQAAAVSISDPSTGGEVIHGFQSDATKLAVGQVQIFYEPFTGKQINEPLPAFRHIVSNLPYVQQEDLGEVNPGIDNVNNDIKQRTGGATLDGRSDLYVYLPFYLWNILELGGTLGIITSNAWLGTAYGEKFYSALRAHFHIRSVTVSGAGRWFENADVVATLLVLEKRADGDAEQKTAFATIKEPLSTLSPQNISETASVIRAQQGADEPNIRVILYKDSAGAEAYGLPLSASFVNCSWLEEMSDVLQPASDLLEINRGERRGWDPLFYPPGDSGIEPEYLQPVLKTARSLETYQAQPDALAFCCEATENDLRAAGHTGALNWIKRFAAQTNKTGIPLPESLKRAGIQWYTMLPNTRANISLSVNPGDRLFYAKFQNPTFVDQRLIRFTQKKSDIDLELVHALLNSITGLFFIEAIGFGRGQGVLDINPTKVRQCLRVLNLSQLSVEEAEEVKSAFAELEQRAPLPIREELDQADRKAFDMLVLEKFGKQEMYPKIRSSLEELYAIRAAVG